jgi:tetratricopeptide (TPR) repeat protein
MGNRIGSAKCLTNLGNSYSALGAFAEALEHHEQALEVYGQLEDASGSADSLCNMGIAHGTLGVGGQLELTFRAHGHGAHLGTAIENTRKALALYTQIGSKRGEVISRFNLGMIYLCLGDTRAAETELRGAVGMARGLKLDRLVMRALSALARAHLLAGEREDAAKLSSEAIDLLGDRTSPEAIEIHFTQFRVLVISDRHDQAVPHLEAAHGLVVKQAETIKGADCRDRFLSAYGELLRAWENYRTTSSA